MPILICHIDVSIRIHIDCLVQLEVFEVPGCQVFVVEEVEVPIPVIGGDLVCVLCHRSGHQCQEENKGIHYIQTLEGNLNTQSFEYSFLLVPDVPLAELKSVP